MKKVIFCLMVISLGLLLKSCNTTEPPPPPNGEKPTLTLTLEDVSCTEAWIELTTTNLQLPTAVTIKQNNQIQSTINLVKSDTLLYIDSLLPNTTYKYQVSCIQNPVSSNELNVTTLDTTSHNFAWQTWTFGTIGSSTLYDCAIISPENIWCVGEINMADTSINGYTTYNAIHWDGIEWQLKRIYYYGSCSAVEYPPLKAIWAFSGNNIVITNGGSIGWFDGNTVNLDCRLNALLTGAINQIWGGSNNDLYVAGDNGNIAWYNGSQWTKIESRITLPIIDIWGEEVNPGEYEIICVASNGPSIPQDMALLRIKNNTVENLAEFDLPMQLNSVWFIRDKKYFLAGDGLFCTSDPDNGWTEETNTLPYYKTNIRGTGYNNIFVVGAFGLVSHYNGVSWAHNTPLDTRFRSVGAKDNTVVAVGRETGTNRAAILLGKQ